MGQERRLPGTIVQCEVCGEYNGSAMARDLNWNGPIDGDEIIGVSCLCNGILCRRCKKNLIHRPGSNVYDPVANKIWHYAGFTIMMPCAECREKEEADKEEARQEQESALSSELKRLAECVVQGHNWVMQSWHHPLHWCWARCERCGLEARVPLEEIEGAP